MLSPTAQGTGTSPHGPHLTVEARSVGRPSEGGFTLVEMMVALLILAVILAIAIPTFLGTTRAAVGRVAQSNSNTALLDSQTIFYVGGQTYPTIANFISTLAKSEKNLTFQTGASTNNTHVSVYVATDQNGVIMAVQSNSKKDCWYTIVNAQSEPAAVGTPYRTLPATVLGAGSYFGEAKLPASGVAPTCQASGVLPARAGSVAYQRGSFPSL